VIAYEKDGFLVDYLRHPDFIFDNIELAYERKADAQILLSKIFTYINLVNVYVAPLRDFQ
jgi:hypothetical protein